jgi:putative membrane protein
LLSIAAVLAASTAPGASAASGKSYSAWDEQWLMSSIQGDRFEVQGGLIAQKNGASQAVRDLGTRLVKDHSKSLKEAVALARKLGIKVPPDPNPSQRWELHILSTYTGADFDRWYADLEVLDHHQDIDETSAEVQKGTDGRVRHMAHGEIPVLRAHLKLSEATYNAVK